MPLETPQNASADALCSLSRDVRRAIRDKIVSKTSDLGHSELSQILCDLKPVLEFRGRANDERQMV
jgi:hypothetical protein